MLPTLSLDTHCPILHRRGYQTAFLSGLQPLPGLSSSNRRQHSLSNLWLKRLVYCKHRTRIAGLHVRIKDDDLEVNCVDGAAEGGLGGENVR